MQILANISNISYYTELEEYIPPTPFKYNFCLGVKGNDMKSLDSEYNKYALEYKNLSMFSSEEENSNILHLTKNEAPKEEYSITLKPELQGNKENGFYLESNEIHCYFDIPEDLDIYNYKIASVLLSSSEDSTNIFTKNLSLNLEDYSSLCFKFILSEEWLMENRQETSAKYDLQLIKINNSDEEMIDNIVDNITIEVCCEKIEITEQTKLDYEGNTSLSYESSSSMIDYFLSQGDFTSSYYRDSYTPNLTSYLVTKKYYKNEEIYSQIEEIKLEEEEGKTEKQIWIRPYGESFYNPGFGSTWTWDNCYFVYSYTDNNNNSISYEDEQADISCTITNLGDSD